MRAACSGERERERERENNEIRKIIECQRQKKKR